MGSGARKTLTERNPRGGTACREASAVNSGRGKSISISQPVSPLERESTLQRDCFRRLGFFYLLWID